MNKAKFILLAVGFGLALVTFNSCSSKPQPAEVKAEVINAETYFTRGAEYFKKGDYDKALEDYNQAIKLDSNLSEIYVLRGEAYFGKGDYDNAFADFSKAITLNPNNSLAYLGRGHIQAYHNRGIIHSSKGDYDKAIEDFNQALKLDPNNEIAKQNLEEAVKAKAIAPLHKAE